MHGMERQAHTHIYTSTLSRRERARRGRRRHGTRMLLSALSLLLVCAAVLGSVTGTIL
jgi:hypothetical protein